MNLFETLIAVAITAVMFTVTSVALIPTLNVAKIKATEVEMSNLKSGAVVFHLYNGVMPSSLEELCSSKVTTQCNEIDPFGNQYRTNGRRIVSAGPDGEFATKDDIKIRI